MNGYSTKAHFLMTNESRHADGSPRKRLTALQLLARCVAVCVLFGVTAVAWPGEAYPTRPVRLLLPFAPGGGSDIIARVITPKLYEALGQQWVIDNRGGAAGNIAAEIVARAPPDGHTVFLGFSTVLTVNPLLYKLPFDVQRDLVPVVMLTAGQYMLVVHPAVKADNLKEFISLAKARPNTLNYASAGIGTPLNLAAELFKSRTGVTMTHVPYKGGGPASAAVLAGEVQVLFASLPSSLPHVKTGRLKALAVTGSKRAALAPELPTFAEAGFPGFQVTSWYGFLVAARTPVHIVTTLHDEGVRMMQLPDVREQIMRQGLEVAVQGPAEFAAQIREETAIWAKVIRNAGIRLE
jgi:tripartite-type tricarboxylate transporter receptor subunit TctC